MIGFWYSKGSNSQANHERGTTHPFLGRDSLLYLIVFFIPFIVYMPTLSGTFYYDDNTVFLGHQVKNLAENPFSVFSSKTQILPGAARSLHVFTLLWIYKLFGPSPLPYHLFNLLFHSLTSLLVFIFIKRITEREIALLSALIFGLHPVHVENITLVTLGGTHLFYTFLALLSLNAYISFRERKNTALLILSTIAYSFSILSKESAVAFILIFPMTEILMKRKGYLWALPHLAILLVLKFDFLIGSASMAGTQIASGEGQQRGITEVIASLGFFVKSLLLPYPLSPLINEFGNKTLLYMGAVIIGVFILTGIILRKRLAVYGGLWLLITSFPYLFVPFIESNVAIQADRYIYMPSIGFSILLSYTLLNLNLKRKLLKPLILTLLIAYSVIGINYFFKAWRGEEAFWRYVVKMNPDYVSGYISLAGIELERGNTEKGKSLILEGLSKPKGMPAEFAHAAYIMGNIGRQDGDIMRAESYYLLSLRYLPYEFSFIELGFLYLQTGNLEGAKWAFENALGFRQQNMRAIYGLAKTYELMGNKKMARLYAQRVYEGARDERLRQMAEEILRQGL